MTWIEIWHTKKEQEGYLYESYEHSSEDNVNDLDTTIRYYTHFIIHIHYDTYTI